MVEDAEERYCIMAEGGYVEPQLIFSYIEKQYGQEIAEQIRKRHQPNRATPLDTLAEYVQFGAILTPTRPKDTGGFIQLKDKGGELVKISTLQDLNYWAEQGIERFIFTPKKANLLCLDIDRNHGDGVDGVENFKAWLKAEKLERMKEFSNIAGGSFPVYVETPNGGFHLYYQTTTEIKTLNTLAQGVEIKYNALSLTCGGSFKDGKPYVLHGQLKNVPKLPAILAMRFSRVLSEPEPKPKKSHYTKQKQSKVGYSVEQLLDFARTDSKGGNHNKIFYMVKRLDKAGYSEDDVTAIVTGTPEHQGRTDKHDTFSCIKNWFSKH